MTPTFFEFLTRDEVRLVFCVAFLENAQGFGGAYPTEKFATPGTEGRTDSWIELFRRAIRYLALDCGVEFEALDVRADGHIFAAGPIEPRNVAYQALFDSGGIPDLEAALSDVIPRVEREVPGLDPEPLRAALSKVRNDLKVAEKVDPERAAGIRRLRQAAIREFMKDTTH